MALTERLALIVDANTRGATRGLDNLGSSARRNLGQAETGMQKLTRSFRDAGPMIAGVAAGATAGIAAFVSLANSAKELTAATGAVDAIFGSASKQVRQFAVEAEALGLSQTKASQVASGLGGQLKSMGFTAEEAGGRVALLAQRAADMAVGLGTTEQAVASIAALIRGEGDPIERFGVSIKQSDVNARLAAQGLSHLEGEAKRTAETTARLDLLFEQTADRVGLYGSEANSAAREQAELVAKSENLRAELGEKLLPVYIDVVDGMSKFIDAGTGVIEVIEGIGDTASAVIPDLGDFGDALDSALPGWARGAVSAIGSVAGAFGGLMQENEELGRVLLGASLEGIHPELGLVTGSLKETGEAADDTAGSFESLFDKAFGVQDALGAIDDGSSKAAESHRALADAQRNATRAADDYRDAQMDVAEVAARQFDLLESQKQAIRDLADEQRSALDPFFAMVRAIETQEKLLEGPKVVVRNGRIEMEGNEPTALELAEGAVGVERAAIGLAGAVQSGEVSLTTATKKLRDYGRQGLLSGKQVDKLVGILEDAAARAETLEGVTTEQGIASEVAADRAEFEAEKAEDLQDANERLTDAKRTLIDANRRVVSSSQDVARSQQDGVRNAENLDRAMFDLNEKVKENPNLVLEASRRLERWVQQGLIPANAAAETLKTLISDVNAAMAAFGQDGDNTAELKVTADISALIQATSDPSLRRALKMMWLESFTLAMIEADESGFGLADVGAIGGPNLDFTMAHGGRVGPNQLGVVGENGPELMATGPMGGFVFSNPDSRRLLSRGGDSVTSLSVVVHNPVGETTPESVQRELRRFQLMAL